MAWALDNRSRGRSRKGSIKSSSEVEISQSAL